MSFPSYDDCKDSGFQWFGDIPVHWEIRRLSTVCHFQSGKAHEPFIDDDGEFICVNSRFVSTEGELRKFCTENLSPTQRDDILMVMSDLPNGRALAKAFFVGDDEPYAVNQRVCIITTYQANAKFLYYQLNRNPLFLRHDDGVNQTHLSNATFTKFPTLIPRPDEQTAIASFLDAETSKIDGLVGEQRRLIELLKEKRQAVISHAVTKGLNPNAPLKPSGIQWLGDVPEHWEVVRLKRIAFVRTGVAKGKDHTGKKTINVPYLRVANVQDGYLDLETVTTIDILEHELERYTLVKGDVLMNEGGDFDKLGRGHMWDGQIDPCITQNHVFAVRPTGVSSKWLNRITSSDYAQFYFMSRSKQSTNLASISSTNLMELPVILPPDGEQSEILEFIRKSTNQFDVLLVESERAIELLQERRTALISAAVTGKIDVRKFAYQESA